MLVVNLSCIIVIILRFVPSIPSLSVIFIMKDARFCQTLFSISIDMIIGFLSLSLFCTYIHQIHTSVDLLLLCLYVFLEHKVLVLE